MVHFFGYKDCKEHLERCEDHPAFLMVKILSSQDRCRFIDVHDIDI